MDALAALLFGMLIALNIKRMGVTAEGDITRTTSIAGIVMGVVMALVYCGLAFAGSWGSRLVPTGSANVTGATILTAAARSLFGDAGVVIIGAIFVLACLNVCTGLLCTVAGHFELEFPRMKYRMLLVVFTVVSLALANFGLAAIIRISVPILNALYPWPSCLSSWVLRIMRWIGARCSGRRCPRSPRSLRWCWQSPA